MARGPTAKQRMFADALYPRAKGNQTLAARLAKYKGDAAQLAVQGSRNMRNKHVKRLLDEQHEAMLQASLETYAAALSATEREAFLTKDGKVVYSGPQPNWKVKLEAARRVVEYCQQSSADETSSKVEGEPTNENTELEQKVGSLSSTDRELLGRTCEIDERLSEVDRQLADDTNGPERKNEN